ncbi:hypothetical protein BpHYR1_028902 [Brachionus plicatilis]|uniref:Uncharacterized protein n=1 Tax=Brachionus plicatilis TaxID=10195 RepID=A0A3M7RZV8_BRAPC|nr:hypothetical protein BpHYR1_028902 [Brachionus plicatilis]
MIFGWHFSFLLLGFMDCFLRLNIGFLLTAVIFWYKHSFVHYNAYDFTLNKVLENEEFLKIIFVTLELK